MKKFTKGILIIGAIAAVSLIAVGPVRLHNARKKADDFAAQKNIITKYNNEEEIGSREAFLTQIRQISAWEKKTRAEINETFGYTDDKYFAIDNEAKSGYEKEEELAAYAMKMKWRKLRKDLEQGVKDAVSMLFEKTGSKYDVTEQAVLTCYSKDRLGRIEDVMESVEKGAGMEAYNKACYGLDEDWSALPMDVAYGLRPKLIMAGCEAALQSAVRSNELYEISMAVDKAGSFAERYHVAVDGLDSAKKKEERLEYAGRPEIPSVGMSTSAARSTKLGSPSRTTSESQSWSHKKHTYGDMVWERGGKQIFRAHYLDGEITDVYDSRNSTAKSPWVSSRKSSSGSAFDPDDHDIEAYYADNRDEYDDYDDAYEGFLDDESAWDDY